MTLLTKRSVPLLKTAPAPAAPAVLLRIRLLVKVAWVKVILPLLYKAPAELADTLLKRLSRYDVPLRELEYCNYTFDLVMDQGAYAEFKRHRMMTQTPQLLTMRLGYDVPRLIDEAGYRSEYESAMGQAAATYEKLAA